MSELVMVLDVGEIGWHTKQMMKNSTEEENLLCDDSAWYTSAIS